MVVVWLTASSHRHSTYTLFPRVHVVHEAASIRDAVIKTRCSFRGNSTISYDYNYIYWDAMASRCRYRVGADVHTPDIKAIAMLAPSFA